MITNKTNNNKTGSVNLVLTANSFVTNTTTDSVKSVQTIQQQNNNTTVIRPVLTVQEKLAQDSPSLPPQVSSF